MAVLNLYNSLEPYEKGYEDAYMGREPRYDDYNFLGVDYRAYARGYSNGLEEKDQIRLP